MSKFFHRKKLSLTKQQIKTSWNIFSLFRFADTIDFLLLIIGILAAAATGVTFPLMLQVYRKIANIMIDYDKQNRIYSYQGNNSYINHTIFQQNTFGCVQISTMNINLYGDIEALIKWYLILGFANILFYWLSFSCLMTSAERQIHRLRCTLFRHLLYQDIGWHDKQNAGALNNNLIEDSTKMKDGMSDKAAEFISSLARTIGCLIFSFVNGWKLTLVFISVGPLIIIAFNITVKVIIKFSVKESQCYSAISAIAHEVLSAIRVVTAFGGQAVEEARYKNGLNEVCQIGIRKGIYLGLCQAVTNVMVGVIFAIASWYGPFLLRTECTTYSGGGLIVIFMASLTAIMSIATLIPNLQYFAEAMASATVIFSLFDQKSNIDASRDTGKILNQLFGKIEFKHIKFQYPTRDVEIFHDLSFTVKAGQTVAIVGDTGCGKSTIIQLILRFYNPKSGQILIDDHPINSVNLSWLRSNIGVVNQDPVLFPISIEENIRLAKKDATEEEIIEACQMANIHDFIMSRLDKTYGTIVNEKLSGGERQRLAIARALITQPKILLLDEATSALDSTSEKLVQQALENAKIGRTTIVIAHRLSTIRNADMIFVMKATSNIVEMGTHDQLLLSDGHYFKLVQAQQQYSTDENNDDFLHSSDDIKFDEEKEIISESIEIDDLELIEIVKSETIQNREKKMRTRRHRPLFIRLLLFNRFEWYYILFGTLTSMLVGATEPIVGVIFASVYNQYANIDLSDQTRKTRTLALIIFFLHVASGLFTWATTWAFAVSGERLTQRMRLVAFTAMLRHEISWFDMEENSVGILTTQLSSDAAALKGLSGIRIGIIVQAFGALITAVVVSFLAGWKLALVMFCFAPLMVFAGLLQGQNVSKSGKTKSKKNWAEQGAQFSLQALQNIRTVVALRCEEHFRKSFEDSFKRNFWSVVPKIQIQALGYAISNSLLFFIHIATFTYGSKLVENGEMTVNQVFRVFIVIIFASTAVGQSMAMMPQYSKAHAAANRIFSLGTKHLLYNKNDISNQGIMLPPERIKGEIEFKNVDFSYPTRSKRWILRNCSFKCDPHTSTALVGKSGYGKSTIINLLLRFYDPRKGSITMDGYDLTQFDIKWLRSMIGVIPQDPFLFNLTVRENIAYGQLDRNVAENEILNVAKIAHIHDAIIKMPQGYETICGPKGSQLSGGEKQRIAIARALLRNPILLLCDEATASLDNISGKLVQQALESAQKSATNRTSLIVAHRLTTIQNCDNILVFNRGHVSEQGTHEVLLNKQEEYYRMWKTMNDHQH